MKLVSAYNFVTVYLPPNKFMEISIGGCLKG